jgi:hypothetical protein
MKMIFKRFLAVFLLGLFLFPLVEKQVHAFEHADEFHCNSTDQHFHDVEHSCSICDYTFSDSNPTAVSAFSSLLITSKEEFSTFCESKHTPSAFRDLPSRAPPLS